MRPKANQTAEQEDGLTAEIWHAAAALSAASNVEKGSGGAGRVWKSAAAEGPPKHM